MSDVQIHWFAIVNSVVIVLFLSGKSFSICLIIFIVHIFAVNAIKRSVHVSYDHGNMPTKCNVKWVYNHVHPTLYVADRLISII